VHPPAGAEDAAISEFSDTLPVFGDNYTRNYTWNGERWVEVDSVKPLNWTQTDECPIYGTEEEAYSIGFADGALQERLAVLQEMSERVALYEDAEFSDAVDVVWDRMSEEDKEDNWPV
jgi:hypothetical protein